MEEEKKKHDFGKGFLVGGLVGLGVGVAGTCVAAALMSDDEPEIEDQEDEQTEETEAENAVPGFISSIVKAAEKAGDPEFKESSIEGTTIQQGNSDV